jgi:hypothetical protein
MSLTVEEEVSRVWVEEPKCDRPARHYNSIQELCCV